MQRFQSCYVVRVFLRENKAVTSLQSSQREWILPKTEQGQPIAICLIPWPFACLCFFPLNIFYSFLIFNISKAEHKLNAPWVQAKLFDSTVFELEMKQNIFAIHNQ